MAAVAFEIADEDLGHDPRALVVLEAYPRCDVLIDACRRTLRRGATPAVLRLYDHVEGARNYDTGDRHVLLVHDEGDEVLVDATMTIIDEECAAAEPLDSALVSRWFEHRNDVSALERNIRRGFYRIAESVPQRLVFTWTWNRLAEAA